MSSVATAGAVPAARGLSRPILFAGGALALLGVIVIGGLAGGRLAGASPLALADIPADYLPIYEKAARDYTLDWAILAAIGKIESDHGRARAPGVASGEDFAGAGGPMDAFPSPPPRSSSGSSSA